MRTSAAEFVFLEEGEVEEKEVGRRRGSEKVRNPAAVLMLLEEEEVEDKEVVEK